ncbi:tubulin domain-containing protein [Coprinopsis sp. MPI-PUGE-AT-0042]|nr:tubulin domain-containing protein [Coprinopsis sp. MPI-PUGE-AT-0042]
MMQDQTLCPRLLMFDWRGNWGTLNKSNSLGQRSDQASSQGNLWNGTVQEIRQAPIPPSAYHDYLAHDDDKDRHDETDMAVSGKPGLDEEAVRYWSDYSRVYYAPTTIQQVPEPPERGGEGGDPNGNWGISVGVFDKYNEAHDLMEDSVRLSLEECDSLQGLQVLNDVDGFGGFISSFLTAFRDDYSTTATLAFGILSGNNVEDLAKFDINNTKMLQATMTDALYLRSLKELGGLTVPIQPPSAWREGYWNDTKVKSRNQYHSSAILSSYIESATLPMRLGQETISSFSSKVAWQSTAPYGELLGTFPVSLANISEETMNFLGRRNFSRAWRASTFVVTIGTGYFASVSRGFSEADVRLYDVLGSARMSSVQVVTSYHANAYPLPSSFPAHMWGEEFVVPKTASSLPCVKGISSIMGSQADSSTSPDSRDGAGSLRGLFEGYAKFAEGCLRRRDEKALEGVGVDADEVRELVNDLWTIVDGHGGGEQ